MKRDWSRVNRERRVWTHGAERSVGFPEPLTGANARGYSSGPRYETILCPLCEQHIPKRQAHTHRDQCRATWEARILKPAWIQSDRMLQHWRNLLHAEHIHEYARVILMLRTVLESHAFERTSAHREAIPSTTIVQRYTTFLTDRDPALGNEFQQLHSELNQMLASAGPIDETLVQVAKTRLIRLLSECH